MVFSAVLFAQLQKPTSLIKLNDEEASWIASVSSLVSPLGLLIIGILTDKIGRRRSLQIAFLPIIVAFVILAYSDSYETILIGRIVGGLVFGSESCIFVYVTEICQPKRRQFFFAVMFMFLGIGNLIECLFAMFMPWQTMSLIFAVMGIVGMVVLFVLPESPVWLRVRNRVPEAERAEQWFGLTPEKAMITVGHTDSTKHHNDKATIITDRQDTPSSPSPTYWSLYTRRTVWMPTLITLGFVVCQQGSGLYVLLCYTGDVIRDFQVQWDNIGVAMYISASRMVGSLVFVLMYNVPRKTMSAYSYAGMALSLIIVIAYGKIFPNAERPYGDLIITAAFISYMFFALLGALQFPWTLSSEVFPSDVTGTMNGVIQSSSYLIMFVVTKLYPSMASNLGVENVWLIYTIVCMLSVLFSIYILPETKGIPLKEILARFEPRTKTLKNDLP
ncbi:Major facilitator superfamily domain,Major facilitator, sugar transporter-like [Cinara cedri]|uniref:Major facilitator superfamily domain,Major facilitator, sugar transporter-like n=1 Tax=Cinara cedri TaxID=506608 RepID=A0A5E4NHZ5_9HEMI|nr:Major facilitator superfamily domain,Major facilitator, sugar transporter-like [Cinara cedri]